MTTGSWNRDAFTYLPYYYGGQWIGRKWNRTWSGTDYGSPLPYNKSTDHVYEVVGLGAGHAREIFESELRDTRNAESALWELQKTGRKAEYLRKKEEYESQKLQRNKESFERHIARLNGKYGREAQRKAEKAWRKLHRIPFPKELLKAPPPRDYIPRASYVIHRPAKVRPKPPKRALVEDHPYTMSETLMLGQTIYFQTSYSPYAEYTVYTREAMGTFGSAVWAPASLLDANDQIKMVNKLREKIQGSDFNLSVFLAEGHRSLQLIGDTAIRVAKSLYHLKRGDWAGTARSLFEGTSRAPLPRSRSTFSGAPTWRGLTDDVGELGSRVLEFQYGFKPLFKDVHAAAEQLAHYLNYPAVKNYRVGVRKESNLLTNSQWTVEGYGPIPNQIARATARSVRAHSRHLIARIQEDASSTLPWALGLLDPELIVWEVIPFSFIADWFVPIGPYLEARAAVSRLRGTFVTSDKMTGKAFAPTSSWFTTDPLKCGYTGVSFTRSISTTLKVPMPTLKPLSQAASFQHCLNGLALLAAYGSGKIRAI